MKLRTLEIHNIASIEDAVIHFDKQPLSGSEVFLITGKTGAGKSTILDSISLALYGTTPRLKNLKMQGDFADNEKDIIKINNPKQMMRRNTTEAWVKLNFVGNNNAAYEASWYVARSYKKQTGKIKDVERTLKNIDDETTLTKIDEIDFTIRKIAVGLDFAQFCRTTMLAQGDFTRFLNSNDEEKSTILEKITGVDIYSRIGCMAFQIANEKQQKMIEITNKLDGFNVMTDDQVIDMQIQKNEKLNQYNLLDIEQKKISNICNWIEKNRDLERLTAKLSETFDEAKKQLDNEETLKDILLVQQWNDTIDIRNNLSNAENIEKKESLLNDILKKKSQAYAYLISAKQAYEKQLSADKESLSTIIQKIETFADKQIAINERQTIVNILNDICEKSKSVINIQSSHDELFSRLKNDLSEKVKEYAVLLLKAEQECKKATTHLSEQEVQLEKIGLNNLRNEKEFVKNRLAQIDTAEERLVQFNKAQLQIEAQRHDIKQQEEMLGELNEEIKHLREQLAISEIIVAERKHIMEQQAVTVDEWAKQIRTKLTVGGKCPVCQQTIITELPSEDIIDLLFAKTEENYKDAEFKRDEWKKTVDECENKITATKQYHAKLLNNLNSTTLLHDAALSLQNALLALNITDGNRESLINLRDNHIKHLNEIEAKINNGEIIDNAVKAYRKIKDDQLMLLYQAKEQLHKAEKAVTDAMAELQYKKNLITQLQQDIKKAEEDIIQRIGTSCDWKYDWREQTADFIRELQTIAEDYITQVEKRNMLQQQTTRCEDILLRAERVSEQIKALMPEWNNIIIHISDTAEIEPIAKIEQKLSDLLIDITSAVSQQLQNKSELEILNSQILTTISASYGKYTIDGLKLLNTISSETIQEKSYHIQQLKNRYEQIASQIADNDILRKKHSENRPTMMPCLDSIEAYRAKISEIDIQKNGLMQEVGALVERLKNNDDAKQQQGLLITAATQAKDEYNRWCRIKELIGSSDGSKFRKIAQSYVLAALIHSANHYMKTLAPRYTLHVQPGSFVIIIEDAFLGYARRATSTISGGESFLVSLSLALALSDIGQHLAVDTLFIDEGFGSLSGEPLMNAINTLRMLHTRMGRHVGIISHVEELRDRIPVQIKVEQDGCSSSSHISITAN